IRSQAPLLRQSGMIAWIEEELARMDTQAEIGAVLDAPFAAVGAWAARHAIAPDRIILGEFGMIRQEWENPAIVPAGERAAYYRAMMDRAEAAGFAWSMWSYSGAFGVVEEFDRRPAEPDVLNTLPTRP
ncbi:MAG: glycosyl hydrolase, partial [Rhizobiaceae bacterium]